MILLSGSVIFSQTVTGTVSSGDVPLPGASILVKGTDNGTISDFDGNFILEQVPLNATLIVSYVGFQTQNVALNGKTTINITLNEDAQSLDEVVIIGYGAVKKSDLTGAIATVKADALEDQPFTGVDQALQGKVSGVTVMQNSGAPGGGVSVRVRGITSLTGNNEPLYVIDGVPVEADSNNDSFSFSSLGGGNGQTKVSALSSINPSDIESMQVLKDASATAIYGSRASNGVVLITTKKGKNGKSTISYESYLGYQSTPTYIDLMNLQEYAEFYKEIAAVRGQSVPLELQNTALLGSGTNWQKEIFQVAPIMNHQVSVKGGTEKTKFYTSINYFDQEGIVINSDFNRVAIRLNLDHKVNDWFKVGNNITVSKSREHITFNDDESGVISSAVRQSPGVPVKYSDGSWGGPTDNTGVSNGRNPVAWAEIRNNQLDRFKINGNFFGEFSILKDFTFRTELGYDYNTTKVAVFNPTYEMGIESNSVATSAKQNTDSFYWIYKNYLNYNKTIGKHSINAMVGQESQESKWEGVSLSRRDFLTNDISTINLGDEDTARNNNWKGTWSLMSYFGRVNYSFDSKYLLTATMRADASSNFGDNNKWGYFPSFSAAWVLSNENFMESTEDIISLAKVRIGYGEVGNQNIGGYKYGAALRNVATAYGTGFTQQNIANPDVKWESTKSTNLGIELGFIDNKIKLDLDLYKKTSADFLFQEPLPSYLGAYNVASYLGLQPPFVNLGEMENKGIDVMLTTRNISNDNFNWTSSFVFSKYKNKLVSLADDNSAIFQTIEFNNTITKTAVGQPVGLYYGLISDGLFSSEEELYNSPSQGDINEDTGIWIGDIKWKDINGDNVIDDKDKTYIGNPHPDFTFSISNNLNYKNWDLALAMNGSYGNDVYNWTRKLTEGMLELNGNQSVVINNRFIKGVNENTGIPRFVFGDPNGNAGVSDRFVEDGSYLRIQNITLGYTLPSAILDKQSLISKVRFYTTIQNLYTFTNYSGYDPEIGAFNQNSMMMGIDNGRYPVPRTYMVGVNVEF
ncbi:TonB-dependent receptor [Lutibacter sp. A64]|uniref:SusC/RagA family TonB-linked outer membrane protein n=1 Tax=Lutibacter sp. A64 TaxID=2918526 RepID=UPI001F05DAB3|nr:TonB-dependent receptor [Lutibacter sp. A64]UMB54151.1 TonB-dependent receptor [Lutibacter sp. A64]